ncbi:MAG: hypothetical protein GWO07_08340 [Candidatus Dadabacteria bacterium]|nr:hypothetical protein [Candidatus Dadabacteria bacterium]NIS08754.1 hypothetical protein [Candidatus Dadabacteria bacterium]NIV42697.1 hypothetical protein [Candidatus Dadabacteria bacterium]NIX15440.1 hypothetical protein [Candidatus Dadabacteria bacterium]NIY22102.1 hypothetical protein [Candidatus Dadabacteria bacterium]
MAHPAIKVSIIVMAISVIYAYIQQIKKDNRAEKLELWVKDNYPDIYKTLPWFQRKLLKSEVSLVIINTKKLIDDNDFYEMYRQVKSFDKKIYIGVAIGILSIVFIILTSHFLGWDI